MSQVKNSPDQMNAPAFSDSSFGLAVAVIRERLRLLPKDDQNDLYSLLPGLCSDDFDERQSAQRAVAEILDQSTTRVTRFELPDTPGETLENWVAFVAGRIKSLRKAAGLTQEELAAASGLPQSHISRLEQGEHSPTQKTLARIAGALGVSLRELDPGAG